MSIQAVCPGCRTSLTLKDELDGKKLRCRHCETVFVAAASRRPKKEEDDEKVATRADRRGAATPRGRRPDDEEDDKPRRKSRKGDKGNATVPIILAVAGVAAVMVVAVAGVVIVLIQRDKPASHVASYPVQQPQPFNQFPITAPNNNPPVNSNPRPQAPPADPAPSSGQLDQDVLRRVKRATVYLRVTLPNGQVAQGSGFFGYKPGLILTNAHVLGMLDPDSRKPQRIDVVTNGGEADEKPYPATVLAVDRSSDLAVLRTPNVPGLPAPLEVKSAETLVETQKVYVFGFPFGEALGKSVTVSESSVSSLRKEGGQLVKVQVNGGMHPGNSGGPVVTARGDVIGVAVSGIRGSQINFAVPGDFVYVILNGRISEMGMKQAFLAPNNGLGVPVEIAMIDPLETIKEVAVDVWTGDPGQSRPPSRDQPETAPGDSPHQKMVLDYKAGSGRAEITLPALPPGKVYWVQPNWVNGSGEARWVTANTWKPPSQPVERKAANLTLVPKKAARKLVLETKMTSRVRSDGGDEFSVAFAKTTEMQESVVTAGPQGSDVVFLFSRLEPNLLVNNEAKPPPPRLLQALQQEIKQVAASFKLDHTGTVLNKQLDLTRVTPDAKEFVEFMVEEVQFSMESLALPLPNKLVQPGEKWSAWRDCPFVVGSTLENGALEMFYTYLGRRTRNGREEAMIALEGPLRGRKGQERRLGGRASGTALIDLATGQTSLAEMTIRVDMDTTFQRAPAKAIGTLEVKLNRTVP